MGREHVGERRAVAVRQLALHVRRLQRFGDLTRVLATDRQLRPQLVYGSTVRTAGAAKQIGAWMVGS